MEIWITRAGRTIDKCSECGYPITAGEFIVRGKYMLNRKLGFSRLLNYHIDHPVTHQCCWIEAGKLAVEKSEIGKIETRGRKAVIILSEDDKRARRLALLRRSSVLQRIRRECAKSSPDVDRLVHLGMMINAIKQDIAPLGGIPEHWVKEE
jgi:hypothetical protein